MSGSAASLAFDPLIPWWSIAAFGGVALLLLLLSLRARARGLWWRALVLASVLAALSNSILVEEERRFLPDIAVIVVDQSESQNLAQRPQQIAAARASLQRKLSAVERLEIREVVLPPSSAGVERNGTRLIDAMNDALSDVPRDRLAGVVLLTDGQVHDVPAGAAPVLGAPIHGVLTGKRGEIDRRLVLDQAPRFGVVGKGVTARVKVEDEAAPGTPVSVNVSVEGQAPFAVAGRVGEMLSVDVPVQHAGDNIVEITVGPGTQELTLENNRVLFTVSGVRDRLRVLLVSGEPYQGERAWRNLLKSDPAVDLVHFTILRTPAKDDFTPVRELSLIVFPMNELFEEKLNEFNLIIFDRYEAGSIITADYFRNIAKYVQDGGALLLGVGPVYATQRSLFRSPLGAVLPASPTGRVNESGFKPQLSALGQRHPITADLPGAGAGENDPNWGRWFRLVTSSVSRGEILMKGSGDQPLLVVNRVGEGRVGQLMSDHLWLWNRGVEGGGPQAELVRRLAHWLMKEPDLEEESMRATVRGNRIDILRRTLAETFDPVSMTGPDGTTRVLALNGVGPGRGTASVTVDKPGIYRFDDGRAQAIAAIGSANPVEFADVRATTEKLQPLVTANAGGFVWLSDAPDPDVRMVREGRASSGRDWFGLQRREAYNVTGVREYPLMPGALLAILLVFGLGAAWYREGR
ncbi:MAG: rane protein [Alphaproteobacteria bacterium]|jgi:hypothetical protein|nr:rane protein [Alphaproteobacteria bacterium]